MRANARVWCLLASVLAGGAFGASGCGDDPEGDAGAPNGVAGSLATTGGTSAAMAGSAAGSGGARAATGESGRGGGGAGMQAQAVGRGGRDGAGAGGGASAGRGGSGSAATDTPPGPVDYELDCGDSALVLEGHGPPANRINYIIAGDGYTASDLETTYVEHLEEMLSRRFSAEFEPYRRYRNFVNICALKVASEQSGVGTQPGNTAFDGYGNDESRLGYIDDNKVDDAIERLLPAEIEVDWKSVVLNGNRWWNAGGRFMVWSGGHMDAALAAEHEGGHSFFRLADEYGGNCTYSGNESNMRINVTMDAVNSANKWKLWFDYDHTPGTGVQRTYEGAEYCDRGAWRPSDESVMNMLWDSPYYNAISREQAVRSIYDRVKPIDSSTPASTTNPTTLEVKVVDPAVIKVDWSVDGAVVAENGGAQFDVAARGLVAGEHVIAARAYDDTDWVRGERDELEQTVQWTIRVP